MTTGADELENATRDELYELAQEEEIEAGDDMSRSELLDAIKQARDGGDVPEDRESGRASGNGSPGRASNSRPGGVGLGEIGRTAREELAALLGREPEGVSSIEREEDGWRVVVEVLELERIPASTDVIAAYAVRLDDRGEVVGYHREQRYLRSQTQGGD